MTSPRRARVAALAAVLTVAGASAPTAVRGAELYGYVQEGIAVRSGEGDIIFHRQTLNIKANDKLAKRLTLRFESNFWVDEPEFQSADVRARIREGYAKLRFKNFDVRAGRVQIVWGEADGVIISDQVSPFDLQNFIVPPFDEIRMGVDGLFVDYYIGLRNAVQAFWITHFQQPDFPRRDSPWSLFQTANLQKAIGKAQDPDAPIQVQLDGIDKINEPGKELANSEAGVRLSSQTKTIDWQIGYLYSWDDRPNVRLRQTGVEVDPGGRITALFTGFPRHNRFHLFTGSFAMPIKEVLFKLDTALEYGRFLQVNPRNSRYAPTGLIPTPGSPLENALAKGFVAEENVSRTLLAVDFKPGFSWWHQSDASIQYIHESVINPHPALLQAEHVDLLSIRLQAAYRNDTIKPWIFAIANVRGHDTWVQTKIDWEPIDKWRFTIEYDWFDGHEDTGHDGGIYGRFDDNDMFLFLIRYSY